MHQVVHSQAQPYKCEICGQRFNQISNLKRHGKIHSDVLHYKCRFCPKAFKYVNSLHYHEGIHTGDKFTCEKCGLSRRSRSGIKNHVCDTQLADKLVAETSSASVADTSISPSEQNATTETQDPATCAKQPGEVTDEKQVENASCKVANKALLCKRKAVQSREKPMLGKVDANPVNDMPGIGSESPMVSCDADSLEFNIVNVIVKSEYGESCEGSATVGESLSKKELCVTSGKVSASDYGEISATKYPNHTNQETRAAMLEKSRNHMDISPNCVTEEHNELEESITVKTDQSELCNGTDNGHEDGALLCQNNTDSSLKISQVYTISQQDSACVWTTLYKWSYSTMKLVSSWHFFTWQFGALYCYYFVC